MRVPVQAVLLLAACGLAGCAPLARFERSAPRGPVILVVEQAPAVPPDRLAIPPGELPSPGNCRTWFPGFTAAHQPQQGRCTSLAAELPAGAWLLSRPAPESVRLAMRRDDDGAAGALVALRVYDAETGRARPDEPDGRVAERAAGDAAPWQSVHAAWPIRGGLACSDDCRPVAADLLPARFAAFLARFPTNDDWHPSCPSVGPCVNRIASAATPDSAWPCSFLP